MGARGASGRKARRSYKVRFWDKNAALDKIGEAFGMFVDKAELTVTHRFADLTEEPV